MKIHTYMVPEDDKILSACSNQFDRKKKYIESDLWEVIKPSFYNNNNNNNNEASFTEALVCKQGLPY